MASLVGKWKLVKQGSDIMPGIENAPGAPLILKLLGESQAEFYKIEKKRILDVEEISLSYVVKNVSVNRAVQIGTLNFEQVTAQEVTLSVVQNIDEGFREFTLVRLGPRCGQSSKEVYRLESSSGRIKLQVEIAAEGTRLSLTRYLARFEDTPLSNEVVLRGSTRSQGWKIFEFWPTTILSGAQVAIVRALKIRTAQPANNEGTKVVEAVWSRPSEAGAEDAAAGLDMSGVTRQFGYQLSEGEEVVEFLVRVTVGELSWFVAHRYKEFDAVRRFLLLQNPHVAEFKDVDAKFPGKVVGLGFRRAAVMQQRVEGLEAFLRFFLENARYCRQNSVDALCSFLKIPENLSSTAKDKAPSPSPAAASTNSPNTQRPGSAAITAPPVAARPAEPAAPAAPTAAKPTAITAATKSQTAAPAPAASKAVPPVAVASPAGAAAAPAKSAAPLSSAPSSTTPSASSVTADAVSQTISSSTSRAKQVARENLYAALEKGLTVLKHGRQGAPKTRQLQCDANVTKLFWSSDGDKAVYLDDLIDIRTGADVDAACTSPAALAAHNANPESDKRPPAPLQKRKSISLLMKAPAEDENAVHFGSANLRRHCRAENMALCIVLEVPDRTLDIQCLSQEDFELLYHNLRVLHRK